MRNGIALEENGSRIDIDDAKRGGKYFCPLCQKILIPKQGSQRIWHFAHKGEGCGVHESWPRTMTQWHLDWQHLFPEASREVVLKRNGIIHRADISLDSIILEFQNSPISQQEFEKRNTFYQSFGKKIIWVFNYVGEDCEVEENGVGPKIYFSQTPLTFSMMDDYSPENIRIFLHIAENLLAEVLVFDRKFGCYGRLITRQQFLTLVNDQAIHNAALKEAASLKERIKKESQKEKQIPPVIIEKSTVPEKPDNIRKLEAKRRMMSVASKPASRAPLFASNEAFTLNELLGGHEVGDSVIIGTIYNDEIFRVTVTGEPDEYGNPEFTSCRIDSGYPESRKYNFYLWPHRDLKMWVELK